MLPTSIRRRLEKAFLQYGVFGTIIRLFIWPFMFLKWRLMERTSFVRDRFAAGEAYDQEHGLDTARTRETEFAADVDSENWAEGTGYAATPPETVRRSVEMLPIDHPDYVFIDLGSGKGRVMLVASEYPFRECIGIEYAPDLHEIAEANIRKFKSDRQKSPVIRSYCHDATTFPMPEHPLVLFFAHPFGGTVLEKFLAHLKQSVTEQPRNIYLVYYDPVCSDDFEDFGFREIGGYDLPRIHNFHNKRRKEFVILEYLPEAS